MCFHTLMSLKVAPARLFLTLLLGASLASCGTNSTFGSGSTSSKELLSFRSSTLPEAYANEPYSAPVAVSGGVNPYTVRVTNGTLPPGVRLNGTTLTGTPTQTGRFEFTLEAADATLSTKSQTLSLNVATLPAVALTPVLGTTSAANTTFRSDTRVPLRVVAPRGARAMRLSWRLPSGVEVTRVQPGEGAPLLLWKQSPGLLTVVLGFTKEPANGSNAAIVSLRFAGPTKLDGTQVGLEARDATGKKIAETALPPLAPVARPSTQGASSTESAPNAVTPSTPPSSGATKVPDTTSAPSQAPASPAPTAPSTEGAATTTPPSGPPASTSGSAPSTTAPTTPAPTTTPPASGDSASQEADATEPEKETEADETTTSDSTSAPSETPASNAAPATEGATPPAPASAAAPTAPPASTTSPATATPPAATTSPATTTPPSGADATAPSTGGAASTTAPDAADAQKPLDLGDFAILAVNFGKSGQNLPGDLDKDGKVDAADVRLFSERYPLP